jgi:ketosteroid isomerase-like protein
MPRTNVDIVHANSDAFSRRDLEGMLEFYSPDAVILDRRPIGWGEFRGHATIGSYYQGIFDNASELNEDLEVVNEQGDTVIASCQLTGTLAGQDDGPHVRLDYALRITLTDGLITTMEIFDDAEAAAAL